MQSQRKQKMGPAFRIQLFILLCFYRQYSVLFQGSWFWLFARKSHFLLGGWCCFVYDFLDEFYDLLEALCKYFHWPQHKGL